MTGFPYLVEAALVLLATFVLGCYIGSGLRRLVPQRVMAGAPSVPSEAPAVPSPEPPAPAPAPRTPRKAKPDVAKPPVAKPPPDPRPPALAAPRNGVKDDLKQIKGIGPRIEASLNALGIFHFSQIARWTKKNVAWVDESLNFRGRIEREGWIEQARALSKR